MPEMQLSTTELQLSCSCSAFTITYDHHLSSVNNNLTSCQISIIHAYLTNWIILVVILCAGSKFSWVKVSRPTQHKIAHFRRFSFQPISWPVTEETKPNIEKTNAKGYNSNLYKTYKNQKPRLNKHKNGFNCRTQHSMDQFWLPSFLSSRQASQLGYCLLDGRKKQSLNWSSQKYRIICIH